VAWILREANRTGVPVTVSGGGTGLTGARVPQGGIVLSTERMNRILKIQEGKAVVQSGVTLREFEEALDSKGLFYPPDPGEKAAFIGGTVATNASGPRSLKYGSTRRYVRRLRAILPNGDRIEIRRGQSKTEDGTFKMALSNGEVATLRVPTYSMPPVKNAAGYFAKPDMDLIDLWIGSEGTLGVFTEVELAILKRPECMVSGVLFFPSEKEGVRFSTQARQVGRMGTEEVRLNPRVLEFFDSQSLALLRRKHPRIPRGAEAALFLEQECRRGEEGVVQGRWREGFQGFPILLEDSWISARPEDNRAFREFRHDLPVLVNEQAARNGFRKIGTDMAVPDENAEAMLDFYRAELLRAGIDYVIFGHLGENHLHVNLLPKTEEGWRQSEALYESFARKAIRLHGTVSAEHGIGKTRIRYLEMMVGRQGLQEMARVKAALDPKGILNPGNIFPADLL
jgi:D-lactate dehydrogenase (cytochrome)